jgi:hypothetical protein
MKVIEKDFLSFYKVAHWNYGVLMTPFTIGLGLIPGHFMSAFFVLITLSMILLSHYYDRILNSISYMKFELFLSFITISATTIFLFSDNIMYYAVLIKIFDIFKEYLIRAESAIFQNSMHVIVKKDYSKFYILAGLSASTLIFWMFPQDIAIFYSILLLIVGDMILIYYKIKMYKKVNFKQ